LLRSGPGKVVAEAITSAENLVVLYGSEGLVWKVRRRTGIRLCQPAGKYEACWPGEQRTDRHLPHANDQAAWELGFAAEADLAGC